MTADLAAFLSVYSQMAKTLHCFQMINIQNGYSTSGYVIPIINSNISYFYIDTDLHTIILQPLTLPEYRKLDIKTLPLKEQRRYWKLLNRQVIKEKNAAGQKL